MSNEVTKTSPFGDKVGMVSPEALKAAMAQSAQGDPRQGAEGYEFMSFSGKTGRWNVGRDNAGMNEDEPFLVNIADFHDGWMCWKGGSVLARRFNHILQPPVQIPDPEENGPFNKNNGEGWSQAKRMHIKSIDTEKQYQFTNNSVSGVSEIARLQKSITERMVAGLPAWPVVTFTQETFKAQGQTNYKPIIKIDGWLSDDMVMNRLAELLAGDAEFDLNELYETSLALPVGQEEPPADTNGAAPAEGTIRRRRRNI